MVITHEIEQGSVEWHKLRDGLYTGSNADKLLRFGKIPYSQSTNQAWSGNFYTRRGHTLEEEAIELYEIIKKVKVDRPGFVTNTRYKDCGYSPDGLLPDRTIEVKAFNPVKHFNMRDDLSFEILAQSYFGQVLCERTMTDVLLYNPDVDAKDSLFIITVKAKRAIHSNIKRIIQ